MGLKHNNYSYVDKLLVGSELVIDRSLQLLTILIAISIHRSNAKRKMIQFKGAPAPQI